MGKGALVFKGDDRPKKKKKKSKHATLSSPDAAAVAAAETTTTTIRTSDTSTAAANQATTPATVAPKIQTGKGKITSSGTVVTGHGTQFQNQLHVGDALLVNNEMRVVTMCLSSTSINLSTAFSSSLVQPCSFQFIAKPRAKPSKHATAAQKQREAEEESKLASGTYASNQELVYREKTEQGSYRIVKKTLDHEASRGELLEMRAKKKSDKYC